MFKTSSAITGGATLSAAALAPLVEWVSNNLFKLSMPPQVVLIVAAGLVTSAHFIVNVINSRLPGKPTYAPTTISREAGYSTIETLVSLLLTCFLIMAMSGCSLIGANIRQYESDAGQVVVQSAERTVCKDIPIGIWLEQYGSNPRRLQGWQSICGNPVQNPLGAETVSAILKVYPSFQQAVDAAEKFPTPIPELVPVPVESTATVPVVTPKPVPKPRPKSVSVKPIAKPPDAIVVPPVTIAPIATVVAPVSQSSSLLSPPVISK